MRSVVHCCIGLLADHESDATYEIAVSGGEGRGMKNCKRKRSQRSIGYHCIADRPVIGGSIDSGGRGVNHALYNPEKPFPHAFRFAQAPVQSSALPRWHWNQRCRSALLECRWKHICYQASRRSYIQISIAKVTHLCRSFRQRSAEQSHTKAVLAISSEGCSDSRR